jgi:hypothetical protein
MKLLVVGPDITDIRRVKNFTGQWAFYLARELRSRNVALHFIDSKHPDPLHYFEQVSWQHCDHALALGLRWFTHAPVGCAAILKSKIKGAVTQLHDGLIHEYLADRMVGVDCTFMFRDDAVRTRDWDRYARSNHYIGWAADQNYLYPEQNEDELRILVDHPYYKDGQPDITEAVTADATMFAHSGLWRDRFRTARVRRLINGGAEDVKLGDVMLRQFDRKHVPFVDIASAYRRTHVYMATHKESVDLTALETACCGAFVTAPRDALQGPPQHRAAC